MSFSAVLLPGAYLGKEGAALEKSEFDRWWASYPRKVGKLAAQKAYHKARRLATAEELLRGIESYIRMKPSYADYCHPKTFLDQGRWLDEAPARATYEWTCHHKPHCLGRHACSVKSA